jgi:hypothetical protein
MKRVPIVIALVAVVWAAPAFAGTPAAKPATATAKGAAKSGARLDEVHIKGEIPEPQVLFVVGRERRRFLDFQHRRYLAERAGAGAAGPSWVRVVDSGRPAAD